MGAFLAVHPGGGGYHPYRLVVADGRCLQAGLTSRFGNGHLRTSLPIVRNRVVALCSKYFTVSAGLQVRFKACLGNRLRRGWESPGRCRRDTVCGAPDEGASILYGLMCLYVNNLHGRDVTAQVLEGRLHPSWL